MTSRQHRRTSRKPWERIIETDRLRACACGSSLRDRLLERPEYADYWALIWSDILRVDRDAVTPQGSVAVTRWLRRQLAENRPYDGMARAVVTAQQREVVKAGNTHGLHHRREVRGGDHVACGEMVVRAADACEGHLHKRFALLQAFPAARKR